MNPNNGDGGVTSRDASGGCGCASSGGAADVTVLVGLVALALGRRRPR
jgi:MYXO-CTERM domain-containing protein